jgi:alpha-glucuronidase
VKNGPIDFQPREPFHPLFGAMPATPLTMEFQLTQEYLGQATTLAYLAPMFKECLESDTYAKGEGSTVAHVIDGSLDNHPVSAMAGVANIGNDRNWCGHPFAQANWYAYGRLAWNHTLTSEQIADEWIRMTLTHDAASVSTIRQMMMTSRETVVKYMTPLGLHHIMGWDHHYGPSPWIKDKPRADWTSVYYHQADSLGIGFNRTRTGSQALSQYFPPVQRKFEDPTQCPEEFLLWFHHLPWTYKMKSGRTLWEELCYQYYEGTAQVQHLQAAWQSCKNHIDPALHKQVSMLLEIQYREAKWWRNSCVLYFQTHSRMAIPEGLEKPDKSLSEYQRMEFPFAPGIRPRW